MYDFLAACATNVGTKKINQDSILLEIADTDMGPILFAAICDGMGGLSAGEKASGILAKKLEQWFETELPELISRTGTMITKDCFEESIGKVVEETGREIYETSTNDSGTTISGILLGAGSCYTINVGDTRVYKLDSELKQLTKDHTVIQQELDEGKITEADIADHPQKHVLLQCVGATEEILPEYTAGVFGPGDIFLVCSDGFRHVLNKDRLYEKLIPAREMNEEEMQSVLDNIIDTSLKGGEKDNISAILIRIYDRGRF